MMITEGGRERGREGEGVRVPLLFKVWAPTGRWSEIHGTLGVLTSPDGTMLLLGIREAKRVPGWPRDRWVFGEIQAINPVCVVVAQDDGVVCHNPRRPSDPRLIPPIVQAWLKAHPSWPAELELDLDNTPFGGESDSVQS